MKKSDWQYIIDTLLIMFIIGIAIIGFLMDLVIPKAPQVSESAKYFLGLQRHQWGNIHFYLSIAFAVLVIIRLIFSWNWIKGKAHQILHRGWGTMLVLITVVSLLVLFLFWALYPRAPGAYEDQGVRAESRAKEKEAKDPQILKEVRPTKQIHEEHKKRLIRGRMAAVPSGILITGKMTLNDLEDITGVPARKIADELGIPSNAALSEHLGRLRKRHPFTMQEVRNIVVTSMKKKRKER